MNCKDCKREKTKRINSMEAVCSWCEKWRADCEARTVNSWNLSAQVKFIEEVKKNRGKNAVFKLQEALSSLRGGKGTWKEK